jgi:hypothetical protein
LTKRDGIIAATGVALGLLAGYAIARSSGSGSLMDAPDASGPTLARWSGQKLTLGEAEAELRVPGRQISAGVLYPGRLPLRRQRGALRPRVLQRPR